MPDCLLYDVSIATTLDPPVGIAKYIFRIQAALGLLFGLEQIVYPYPIQSSHKAGFRWLFLNPLRPNYFLWPDPHKTGVSALNLP